MKPDYVTAWADLRDGIVAYQIWGRLGWQEVKRRYRRTVFGPFWATLSLGIFIGAISFVWAPIFHVELKTYLPYLTAGMIGWSFTSTVINEGCNTFISNEGLIKQLNFPYSTFAFMTVWRNIIVMLHHLVILVAVYIWLPNQVSINNLLFIPGLVILAANGAWICILLGLACTRYRDIPPLVANLLQVILFVTPIFWSADQIGERIHYLVYPNYLFHLIDLIRAPLLGTVPSALSYAVTIAGAFAGWAVTFMVYARFRRRIAFWF